MKLRIQHNSELVLEIDSLSTTRPDLWDNLVNEAITYATHLHSVEGGNTAIILKSNLEIEKRASDL